ncbi:PREDICTED: serine carboxypeptidase-like 49 [Camelina sativa]|uniref:Carboxypeptidase n=1 Tax=Camelina sativa TaxID=90675 RepID=A0ABM0XIW8_CAMSA|nr:PREDICTED: serine carboxypeptidase-like 49 [Camelina sativa]
MEKLTFLSRLLHFVVFVASTFPSSSFLLNDRTFERSNLPSTRAEKLIRELNLFPQQDLNVIDVADSPLTAAEGSGIVERKFVFPNILAADGGDTVEDLGHHAGYYKLPKSRGASMFYFFFESRKKKDAPVVIWLTGGPGCSSELAVFYENGPFKITNNMSLAWNEYGWDQVSNLLYVDQPVGTGFSFTTDKSDIRHDETGVSNDLYDFLQAFFKEHPKLAKNDFYITGESYAGHYIPAFASRVHKGNKANEGIHVNLKGFAIGNGLTDPAFQYPAYPDFALEMGLITQKEHDRLEKIVPLCELSIKLCGTDGTTSCLASYLVCNALFSGVLSHAGGVNYYDIRKKCVGSLCYDFSNMEKFLNLKSVRKSLGVGDIDFVSCSTSVYQAMLVDWMRNLEVGIPELLEDGINLLVYAGEYDLICNWLGNSRWVNAMDWSGKTNFGAAEAVPFMVDGKEAGSLKTYEQLSFLKVRDAGHMVPMDQPKAALAMLKRWMENSLIEDATIAAAQGEEELVAQM